MEANEIIQKIIDNEGINAKFFSEKLGFKRPQVIYDVLKGKTKSISNNLANKIVTEFPQYSKLWLLTGEGDDINSNVVQNDVIEENRQKRTYTISSDNLMEIICEKDRQIQKRDEQIDRLISILEKK